MRPVDSVLTLKQQEKQFIRLKTKMLMKPFKHYDGREIIFWISRDTDGVWIATSKGGSICAHGNSFTELDNNIRMCLAPVT